MNKVLVLDTTSIVKNWLMYLDSISNYTYTDDLAIRLYNVTKEDDYGAWDDWVAENCRDPVTGGERYVPYLDSDEEDGMEEFTNAMSNILIGPVDEYFANMGLEIVCICDSKVIRTLNNDFTVYSTIEVKELRA